MLLVSQRLSLHPGLPTDFQDYTLQPWKVPERKQVKCCLLTFLSAEKETIDTSLLVHDFKREELLVHFFSFSSSQIMHIFVPKFKNCWRVDWFCEYCFWLFCSLYLCKRLLVLCVQWKATLMLNTVLESLQQLVLFVQKSETTTSFQTEFKGGKTISWLVF